MLSWPVAARRSLSFYRNYVDKLYPTKGSRGTLPSLFKASSHSILSYSVVVAMSGGVDSSVVAKLLSQEV